VPLLGDAEGAGVVGLGVDGDAEVPPLVGLADEPELPGRLVPLPALDDPMSPPEVACATTPTPPSPGA
jgi:hypothetical protein